MHQRNGKYILNFNRKNLKRSDLVDDLDVEGRIILKLILNKQGVNVWT